MVGLLLTSGWGIPIERAKHYLLVMAIDPFKFLQEVRAEAQKVTWPTRKETTVTTMMVFVMVILASIFFFGADQLMRIAVTFLLTLHLG